MLAAHSQTSLTYLWGCLSVEMAKVREILAAEKPVGDVVYDGWMNKYPDHLSQLYDEADRANSMLGMTGKTIRVRVYEVPEAQS